MTTFAGTRCVGAGFTNNAVAQTVKLTKPAPINLRQGGFSDIWVQPKR
ncbi:hypothetical protein [Coleofasciculus sp. G2-EDA-02]